MMTTGKFIKYALVGSVMGVTGGIIPNIATAQGVSSEQERIELASRQWRISLAGKLGTLNQIMAADACYLSQGVRSPEITGSLHKARVEFRGIVNALENGDPALGLPDRETDQDTLRLVVRLIGGWNRMDQALEGVVNEVDLQRNARIVAEANAHLEDLSSVLAAQIETQYANPNKLAPSDAMAVSIARRQRSLVQELRKSVCHIMAAEVGAPDATAEFAKVSGNFEQSLIALRDGMPSVGIAPPPDQAIVDEIDRALDKWNDAKPVLLSMALSGSGTQDDLLEISDVTANLQLNMDNVVTRYLIATLGDEDIYRIPLKSYAESELAKWFSDPVIIDAVRAQNQNSASLSQADIDALDQQWRDQTKGVIKPLIEDVLSRPASDVLARHQTEAAGFVTEVFVMDNRGLNVAQSEITSDFWQGDEAKWQEVVGNGSGNIHISDVEYDDSTKAYQAQISVPIKDPETDELIGGATLGVNIQFLL